MVGRSLCSGGPSAGSGGLPRAILLAALVMWMPQALAQISFNPKTFSFKEGEKVTLTLSQVKAQILYFNWFQGTGTNVHDNIIGYFTSTAAVTHGNRYTGRETVLPNGELRIEKALKNDTGNYTIQMQLASQPMQQATVQLTVTSGYSSHAPATVMMELILLAISSFL